ncbi:hypothetical protein [Streptomyces sp. AC602_WCS936]|uniref:hypothetical protein n=1 Tax=Streptomyces sp. AC602_WCS936 TaxID=2823685 RepID=UPI001C264B4C|nr:hypothetical protein [Streptomyces sp. AC602_WCS936]
MAECHDDVRHLGAGHVHRRGPGHHELDALSVNDDGTFTSRLTGSAPLGPTIVTGIDSDV